MKDERKEAKKRAYEKPSLRIIELTAEEVLVAGCKTSTFDSKGVSSRGCGVLGSCAGLSTS